MLRLYDTAGRIGSVTVPEGNYSYSYDPSTGKPADVATPDGQRVTPCFWKLSQLKLEAYFHPIFSLNDQ